MDQIIAFLLGFLLLTAAGALVAFINAWVNRRFGKGADEAQMSYVRSLEGSLKLAQQEVSRFTGEANQLRGEMAALRSEVADLRRQLMEIGRENDRLRAENMRLIVELNRALASATTAITTTATTTTTTAHPVDEGTG